MTDDLRKRIYSVLEETENSNKWHNVYSYAMLFFIIASIIPLLTRETTTIDVIIEKATVGIFIIDYLFRWFTAPCALKAKGWKAYLLYPFTFFAIIDLLSILPAFGIINGAFKVARFTRLLRLTRILKLVKYSDNIFLLVKVIKRESKILLAVFAIAIFYIFISASIMFSVEPPEMFPTFFDALYWATSALTTIGYGDIYPISNAGKVISMISSILGIAVIALPSGVITAGFMKEIESKGDKE